MTVIVQRKGEETGLSAQFLCIARITVKVRIEISGMENRQITGKIDETKKKLVL